MNENDFLAILEISYDRKFVMDLDSAIEVLKALSKCEYIIESYKDKYEKPQEAFKHIALRLISRQKIKEKILEQSLEIKDDNSQ